MKKLAGNAPFIASCVVIYFIFAAILIWVVTTNGTYPSGVSTYGYIYNGQNLYNSAASDIFFPTYDALSFNGVESLRFWEPIPIYLYALNIAIAGGEQLGAYTIYVAILLLVSALPWLFIGIKLERKLLGAFLGLLWFFTPNNLIELFSEGNLGISTALAILPIYIFLIYQYLQSKNWKLLPFASILMCLIVLCHASFSIIVFSATVLYLLIYGICNKQWVVLGPVIVAPLLGFLLAGFWLVPFLTSDANPLSLSATQESFFQSLITTISPYERYLSGNTKFYFGAAALVLCVFGIICSKKKSLPGFIAAIVILLCTSSTAMCLFAIIPGGKYINMLQYISVALCLALLGFLVWNSLKKTFTVALCILLAVDVIPSLSLIYGNFNATTAEERLEQVQEYSFIDSAQEITTQRLALLDASVLDSESSYLANGFGNVIAISEGVNGNSATTSTNYKQLDRALEGGNFLYLFDRALEMGNDTVLIRTQAINGYNWDETIEEINAAAGRLGYKNAAANVDYRLYKLDTSYETWGTQNQYQAIGIGSTAPMISLFFPSVEETSDTNLNHYSFEDLSQYKTVFLSGFTYDVKSDAEELVTQLSENGTKVVILADGIPVEKNTHNREFLDVRCNDITFNNGYPTLDTIDGQLVCNLFPQGSTTWNTVFLDGLDEVWGSFDTELDDTFEFYGTKGNENIVFIGLNLTYHLALTQDTSVEQLLSHAIDISTTQLPERTIVPVEVTYSGNSIELETTYNNVNTALAWHESFEVDGNAYTKNNMTFINSGTTKITVPFAHFGEGVALSLLSVICVVIMCLVTRRNGRKLLTPISQNTSNSSNTKEDAG